jgi:hypothetical protein
MNAETRNEATTSPAPTSAGWMSRLSLRPSTQFDEGASAPESFLPGGKLAQTVVICCALALAAAGLRGLAVRYGPEGAASAGSVAAAPAQPSGD